MVIIMADKKYKFYVNSDNITNKTQDTNRIKKFVQAFKDAGHKAKYSGLGSDTHSHPDRYGCKGSDSVWVVTVGGDCAGTYRDMCSDYFKKRLNGAKLVVIRVYNKGGCSKSASSINKLGRAHDDNFSVKNPTINSNLDKWFTKHGIGYYEGNTTQIIKDIKAGKIKGAGLEGFTTVDASSQIKLGYSTSNPFKAYLNIQYTKDKNWDNGLNKTTLSNLKKALDKAEKNYTNSVTKKMKESVIKDYKKKYDNAKKKYNDYINGKKPSIKQLNVDFSLEAPEATTTNKVTYTVGKTTKTITIPPSFNNNLISWLNNTIRENSFNLLKFIQEAEKDYNQEHDYYLYKVSFKSGFGKDNTDKIKKNDKNTSNVLYDKNDQASYKMNLYSIGLYKGDIVTAKNYGSSGKKINDVIKEVLNEINYHPIMNYGKYRFNDRVKFIKIDENTKPVFDFYDMEHWNNYKLKDYVVDGNILELSNVQYTPINDTLNNSLYIFKGRYDILRDNETMSYFYERYCNLNNILKYGEQTLLGSDTSNNLSSTEAYNRARESFLNNYEERRSYTIKVAGIPPISINNLVRTYMDNPLLDSGENGLKVSSIEWNINPDTSPCIETTIGLGKPDKKFEISKILKIQKERAKNKALDIPTNVSYSGDENIDNLL